MRLWKSAVSIALSLMLVSFVVPSAEARAWTTESPNLSSSAPAGLDTVFVLQEPVPLTAAVAALEAGSARVVAFEHATTTTRGGFYSRELSLDDAVRFYRESYARWHEGEPSVFAVRFEGAVPTTSLQSLAGLVLRRAEVARESTVVVDEPSSGGAITTDPETAPATIPNKKPWAPESGFSRLYDNTGLCFPGIISCAEARGADLYLTFERDNPGADFAADWAYEHDFKLYNENNWNTDYICPRNQQNDFWAYRDAGISWDTTMPNPYLDTRASDHCRWHDLTVGSYRPDRFVKRTYDINLFVAPGDHSSSPYLLQGEVLDKDCEVSPWCVGIGGYRDHQRYVGETRGVAPGCRRWVSGEDSQPC